MPTKPKKPCGYPGCPKLTHDRYCEEHTKVMNARYNKYERPYDSSERYGAAWRRIRNRYIKAHPLCEECLKQERLTPSKEVHHIVPLEKGKNFIKTPSADKEKVHRFPYKGENCFSPL